MTRLENQIIRLELRKHARKRPDMYFGGTDIEALHFLIDLALDNLIKQAFRGQVSNIIIGFDDGQCVSIADDWYGYELEEHKHRSDFILRIIAVKMENTGLDIGSLFGALVSVCHILEITHNRDGFSWHQTYGRGQKQGEWKHYRPLAIDEQVGTKITFRPDFSVVEFNEFDLSKLVSRLNNVAYLIPGLIPNRFKYDVLSHQRVVEGYGVSIANRSVAATDVYRHSTDVKSVQWHGVWLSMRGKPPPQLCHECTQKPVRLD